MIEPPQLSGANPQLQKAMNNVVKAENIKLERQTKKVDKERGQLQLIQDIKGKFNALKDAIQPFQKVEDFRDLIATSSDGTVLGATVDKTIARPGSYEFEVVSLARTDSVMTYGFPDRDKSEVGVGYVKINLPEGGTKNIYINSDNNSLDGVAKAINSSNTGVRAYVVNDGTDAENPWRLVMTGEDTGWREDFEYPEFYMLDGDLDLDVEYTRDAASAKIRFNGQPIYADKNTVTDLLPGVNIDLKSAKEGQTVKLEIKPDVAKIEEKAKNFVDKMNDILTFMQDQNKLIDPTDPRAKEPRMNGDVSMLGVEFRLTNLIQKTKNMMPGSTVQGLRDVGITFNRNGTLDFESEKFQTKLESDFDDVATLFSGTGPLNGFAYNMTRLVEGITRTGDGTMSIREKGLQNNIKNLERKSEQATERAESRVQKSREQLARAEGAIQRMQQMNGQLPQAGGGMIGQ